ncbi:glycosyltransferase family protein [Geodermatophilus chilensis]|uniref:glycosyltransferase family protein n=1 Tax=Geodermatophilus chilensis TaxID=2035835 RepID=UPI0012FFFB84|nr:phosphotransferase [Geodermatophilus chilensis]
MPAASTRQPRRIALYSHDTQGLGHTRRNATLAAALVAAHPDTDVLLLTGNPEAAVLPLPPRTDVVTLPTLRKDADGRYAPRTLAGPLEQVLDVRSRVLEAVLGSFAPDLLVADKVAADVRGELLPALDTLREQGGTRVVLGLREVLDRPAAAVAEWDRAATTEVLGDYYDQVWVYGDPAVYDPVEEYGLPAEVAAMVVHTGYLGHGRREGLSTRSRPAAQVRPPAEPYVLCTVGGGQDGAELARAFAAAPLPAGCSGVLLTGPFMSASVRDALRATAPDPAVPLHRDLHDRQVLVAGDGSVGLLDFDLLAAGEPALDLANLLAHLSLRQRQGLVADAAPLRAAVLEGYRPSSAVAARVPVHEATTRLRLAAVYAFRPGAPAS